MNKKTLLLLLLSLILATSCSNNILYSEYQTLPVGGWHKDSPLVFDVEITDTQARYNVLATIRNNTNYPYQNIWFFVSLLAPENSEAVTDTLEYFLADARGKWLGSGSIGSIYSSTILLQKEQRFTQVGLYRFSIQHGMRDDMLKGIRDVTLEIQKNSK